MDIPSTAHTHGYDLSPYLRGTPGTHREQEVLIYYPHYRRSDYFASYLEGDWKLTRFWRANNRFLLFNLANDPTESNNLAASMPEKVLQMARGMARQFDEEWGTTYGTIWPTYPSAGQGAFSTAAIMNTLDLDNDGRIDVNEDLNGNGLVDPGETDPDDSDSDDDGTDDHSEIRLGLDPLSASEFFKAKVQAPGTGNFELTWPSQPGLTFRVRRSDDPGIPLSDWITESNIPADSSGGETSRSYPHNGQRSFFVVEME